MPGFAILLYLPTPADRTSTPDDELAAHGTVDAYALSVARHNPATWAALSRSARC